MNFNKSFISVKQICYLYIKLQLKLTLISFSFFITIHSTFVLVGSNNSLSVRIQN